MLSRYIVDYTHSHIPSPFGPLDEDGLPLWNPKQARLRGGPLYNPIVVIQYGLAHYDLALDGDSAADAMFLRCARWVEENAAAEPRGRFAIWPYTFPLRTPPVKPPWISGMAQGQALSLLARAYVKTRSAATEAVARHAAQSFCYTLSDGGIVAQSASGALFIEEVAHSPAVHILNGCLYGLFGLWEYTRVFEDPEVEAVLERCIQGVDEALPLFDMGWWSRYSLGLRWHMATHYYHEVHIRQLDQLASALNRPEYGHYARRWEAQQHSGTLRLRRNVLGVIEVNLNRALTVLKLNRIKYKRTPGWGS